MPTKNYKDKKYSYDTKNVALTKDVLEEFRRIVKDLNLKPKTVLEELMIKYIKENKND